MAQWEFLLQQEGDRTWLPLESTTVEILEGRYRVMAHSSYTDTAVEIHVSHLLTDTLPPKRRVLRRNHRTNPEGLIVVMPFTQLTPGRWDLNCIDGDLMDDMLGKSWQYAVQLQVLPRAADEGLDDSDSWEDQRPADLSTPWADWSPAAVAQQHPVEQFPAEQPQEAQPIAPAPAVTAPTVPAVTASAATAPAADIPRLAMSESAYVILEGRSLTLEGQFYCPEPDLPESDLEAANQDGDALELVLHIYLRDPQSGDLIDQVQTPLAAVPDQPFAVELNLPADLETRLLLGEALVQSSQAARESHIWATQTFTVTRALNELLEVVADRAEAAQKSAESEVRGVPMLPTETVAALPLGDSIDQPKSAVPLNLPGVQPNHLTQPELLPSPGWSMPPQIAETHRGDELSAVVLPPRFGQAASAPSDSADSSSLQPEASGSSQLSASSPQVEPSSQPSARKVELPNLRTAPSAKRPADDSSIIDDDLDAATVAEQMSLDPQQPWFQEDWAAPDTDALEEIDLEAADLGPDGALADEADKADAFSQTLGNLAHSTEAIAPDKQSDSQLDQPAEPAALSEATWEIADAEEQWADATGENSLDGDAAHLSNARATATDPASDADPQIQPQSSQPQSLQPVDRAFQSLDLQTRFWDRLNAFTAEGYEAAQALRSAVAASEVVVSSSAPGSTNPIPPGKNGQLFGDRTANAGEPQNQPIDHQASLHEVVIYDDSSDLPHAAASQQPHEASEGTQIADDDRGENWVVPVPEMLVPETDLRAGEPLPIRVVLPDVDQRLYVKLWLSDRQTRMLVDEPRWLMYLEPDGQGTVTTTLRVTVPMHCLELQISAIAIDMPPKRERERVVCDRRVLPANIPSLSLEEFEV